MAMRLLLTALLSFSLPLGAEWPGAARIDALIEEAIEAGDIPGGVVLVGRGDRILHHRAIGSLALVPEKVPARLDGLYDCASLTKVVATAPVILSLVEEGKLRLNDRVTTYLPKFSGGRSPITVRQLLTHTSGLRPDLDLEPQWEGYETGIRLAYQEVPLAQPDTRFIYSDINFILLAEIARELTGKRIDELARERVFEPLGMKDTSYLPALSERDRIAPTVRIGGELLRGVVHDPTTRYMGGVAGHAGMFSTAADLGRYCRMMLGRGALDGKRLFSPLSIAAMTRPQTPEGVSERGLGWDINSRFASLRGDLYPPGSFGHTGYTGTSVWIDPSTDSYVVLLTNRAHPVDSGSVVGLRARVSSVTAAAIDLAGAAAAAAAPQPQRPLDPATVLSGLDVLVRDGFAQLAGKRVGLITNHTGVDRYGRRAVDLFADADNVELAAVFAPEHGFAGELDQERIGDASDAATGLKIHSLYQGDRRRPTPAMLEGLDALVFDIQDIGARFYTYPTTMAYAMEEAAKAGIEFWVLDRPNPINGVDVEGPPLDERHKSFVGYFPVPVRHGMTIGELAEMHNDQVGADLHVVRMEGWRREMWFDETGLPWINPSPNIRSLTQATLYPGVALLEGLSNYSVGRGTDAPFEFVGADWIDGAELAREINAARMPGVGVYAVSRRPTASKLKGKMIEGVQISISDRNRLSSLRLGLEIASALARLYPREIEWGETARLTGHQATLDAWRTGRSAESIWETWSESARRFERARARYLLYD